MINKTKKYIMTHTLKTLCFSLVALLLLSATTIITSSCRNNVSSMSSSRYEPSGLNRTSYSRSKVIRKNIRMKAPRTDKSKYNKNH